MHGVSGAASHTVAFGFGIPPLLARTSCRRVSVATSRRSESR